MAENMFAEMITMFCLVAILVFSIDCIKDINVFINTNEIARKSILKMETKGELNNNDKEEIKRELEKMNLRDVNVVSNKATNGDEIFLLINYEQEIRKVENGRIKNVWEKHNIQRSSTAKN